MLSKEHVNKAIYVSITQSNIQNPWIIIIYIYIYTFCYFSKPAKIPSNCECLNNIINYLLSSIHCACLRERIPLYQRELARMRSKPNTRHTRNCPAALRQLGMLVRPEKLPIALMLVPNVSVAPATVVVVVIVAFCALLFPNGRARALHTHTHANTHTHTYAHTADVCRLRR